MQYFGEIISIAVAVSWTFTALFFEFAGKRIGSLSVNLLRLVFAFFLLGGMLLITTGSFSHQKQMAKHGYGCLSLDWLDLFLGTYVSSTLTPLLLRDFLSCS